MNLVKERELPYGTTQVSIEQTELEISRLLRKYEINDRQMTECQGKTFLKFMYNNKPYMIELPDIKCLKYNGSRWVPNVADKRISMRMMYYFLKSVLEHSAFSNVEQLLLSYRLIKVNNQVTTVGKVIDSNPDLLLGSGEEVF